MKRLWGLVLAIAVAHGDVALAGEPQIAIEERSLGQGTPVAAGDKVVLHYTLRLPDGTILDQSPPDRPLRFTIGEGEVIQGFDQGVRGMRPGAVRLVTVPPELGYGKRGAPPVIPGNATLIFEIRLVGVSAPRIPPEKAPAVETWTTLASGTKTSDITVGVGPVVGPGARVRVDYTIWNADTGERVDTTYQGDDAVRLPLDGCVPGFRDGVIGMAVGGTRAILVEPEQGYGNRDVGQIPAGTRLLFLVELDGIEP